VIVLDTHAWLWWWAQERHLSLSAVKAIRSADKIAISAISCWELARLAKRGRINLGFPTGFWIDIALAVNRVVLLEITSTIALVAAELSWDNRDPADRFLVATAMVHEAPIVTKDRLIHGFAEVQSIW